MWVGYIICNGVVGGWTKTPKRRRRRRASRSLSPLRRPTINLHHPHYSLPHRTAPHDINHSPLVLVHVPQTRNVRMSPVVVYPEQCVRFGSEERCRIGVTFRQSLEGHPLPRGHRRGGMDPAVRALPEDGVVIDDVLVGHRGRRRRLISPTTKTTATTVVVVVVVIVVVVAVVAIDATPGHRPGRRGLLPPMREARGAARAPATAVGVVRRTTAGSGRGGDGGGGGGRWRFASCDDVGPGRPPRRPPSMLGRTTPFVLSTTTVIDDGDDGDRRSRGRRRQGRRRRDPPSIVMPQMS